MKILPTIGTCPPRCLASRASRHLPLLSELLRASASAPTEAVAEAAPSSMCSSFEPRAEPEPSFEQLAVDRHVVPFAQLFLPAQTAAALHARPVSTARPRGGVGVAGASASGWSGSSASASSAPPPRAVRLPFRSRYSRASARTRARFIQKCLDGASSPVPYFAYRLYDAVCRSYNTIRRDAETFHY